MFFLNSILLYSAPCGVYKYLRRGKLPTALTNSFKIGSGKLKAGHKYGAKRATRWGLFFSCSRKSKEISPPMEKAINRYGFLMTKTCRFCWRNEYKSSAYLCSHSARPGTITKVCFGFVLVSSIALNVISSETFIECLIILCL